ncbi:hypothetical protein LINPERHAP1_LOCUS21693, partial [Linum perenne]
ANPWRGNTNARKSPWKPNVEKAPQDKTLILKGRHPSEGLPKPEGNGDQRRRGDHR